MNVNNSIEFTLNGRTVAAPKGETILSVAQREGVEIPHLCYKDGMRPDGNCRACMVEIDGERVLAPSCCRAAGEGMVVNTESPRARKAQSMVLELLSSDLTDENYSPVSELDHWRRHLNLGKPRFATGHQPHADLSHPAMAVNLDACIKCTRCQRACREVQGNDVIGFAFRGEHSAIVFDLDDPMGESSCVGCGECVQACPTGALMPAADAGKSTTERSVDSVCPYCGVGCLLRYHIDDNRIRYVTGRDGPANRSRLCVKGRYGFDYVSHPQRLTTPLIRREGVPKGLNEYFDPSDPLKMFRPADWDEALALAAGGLRTIRDRDGGSALAGFGSAKGSNEEAYLFQKLVRTGFATNNVDHCTRLCHASSVAALLEGIGSGRGIQPGQRRVARRGGSHYRLQYHQQSSGGGNVHEECRPIRRQADRDGSHRDRHRATCALLCQVQGGYGCGIAQGDDAYHRLRGAGGQGIRRGAHRGIR
jgi:formate dehydrogenase major subunit